ncbi:hypothetical protein C4565_00570 [Candidatus Parcubacteria bacterium]|nr:MAG: hypothetical protein C4565_00570 [Candidatus Parcubacteria bacterium]
MMTVAQMKEVLEDMENYSAVMVPHNNEFVYNIVSLRRGSELNSEMKAAHESSEEWQQPYDASENVPEDSILIRITDDGIGQEPSINVIELRNILFAFEDHYKLYVIDCDGDLDEVMNVFDMNDVVMIATKVGWNDWVDSVKSNFKV